MLQTFEDVGGPAIGRAHLPLLREALAKLGLDGLIVPHEDEYQNEYVPAAFDRLGWLTGFTGSAGAAIVLAGEAAIFVDGRYTLQARDQVDDALFEHRDLVDGGPSAYLRERAPQGARIGYDAQLFSPDSLARLRAAAESAGAALVSVEENPIDMIWADRPAVPAAPVVPHPEEMSGESAAEKRRRIGEIVAADGADAVALTSPASIAWLFNIRGGDVARTPLPLAEAILLDNGRAEIFLDPAKISEGLAAWVGPEVALRTPAELESAFAALAGRRVRLDPNSASAWHFEQLAAAGAEIVRAPDPVIGPRACKNAVEIEGARRAHLRDGAALTRFLAWLDSAPKGEISEIDACRKLESFRGETGALKDLSFDSITGSGPHGAIVHYRVSQRTDRKLQPGELFLIDSGAQYLDGTTDVTRTIAIGEPDAEMRRAFTLVLKGHIALARVRFPKGTTGPALDALARTHLWAAGLDYDHGTGHGVGSYLGVHEGPQRISKSAVNAAPLEPGMIVSNEPGYYKAGGFGIRIENLVLVTPAEDIPGGERPMLGFETLTLAPIDRRLIDLDLLERSEREWMDAYHARVGAALAPLLPADSAAWLAQATAPL